MQRVGSSAALAPELLLDLLQRVGIEQVAQLIRARQLPQEVAVEGQRRDTAFGGRRIVLVEVLRHVFEVERGREGRGGLRLDGHELVATVAQAAEEVAQRAQVEVVGEQLAVGLEQDRERAVALGDGEQRLRPQPLLPQRRALARSPARDQEGARGALAEAGAEQRRAAELADDEVLEALRVDRDELVGRQHIGIGEVQDDAVVRPQRVRLDAVLLAQERTQRESPGRVDTRTERREHAQAPVADLIAEALHDDRAVGWQDAGRELLLAQVPDQRACGAFVAGVQARQPRDGALVVERGELALQPADGAAQLERAAGLLAFPERHLGRLAGGGGDEHAVALDLLDPPGRGAQQEDLPLARLVHHLLVELAHAAAAVDQEDAVEAAVGDRPGVRDRDPLRALAGAQHPGRALPHDARAQLGELVRGVAAGEQVEHVLELLARELAVGVRAPHERVQLIDLQLLDRGHGDDLLAQHVERDARHARVLDLALEHAAGDRGRLHELAAEARVDAPARRRADGVAGAADALQAARHRARRRDLHHEVDGAHVDAELERRGGDDAGQRPGLERLLDLGAGLARERAVVCAGDGFVAELVEPQGQSLGHAPAVHEHDRGVVRMHQLEQLGVERGPEGVRAAVVGAGRVGHRLLLGLALDRHLDPQVEFLAHARVDDAHVAVAAHEARDLLQRALRRGQRDALRIALAEGREPLQRECEVRTALGCRDGVHLVDDHGLDAGEHLPGARGEQEVEALGRRDEHVRRRPQHAPALLGRRVARAHRDARRGQLEAGRRSRRANAGERRAQVALDVVVECLEGRDVEHPQTLAGLGHEAVEEPQERRQRLAGSRGGAHEHVLARGDGRPALRLRGGRGAERALEPAARVRGEPGECVSGGGGHRRRTIRPMSAQQQVEREQGAGGHDHRGRQRDAGRDQAVARRRALTRAEQRAQGTAGQGDGGDDHLRVGPGGPDQERGNRADRDVLGAAGAQREPREHEQRESRHQRPGARGHAECTGNDGQRDRDDVGAPHGSTVVETARARAQPQVGGAGGRSPWWYSTASATRKTSHTPLRSGRRSKAPSLPESG